MAWSLLKRRTRTGEPEGRTLYAAAVSQARNPAFYRDLGVADSANGRFELYSLHVILILRALKGRPAPAPKVSQSLFDTYVSSLDDALREQGVGDLSMAKKMRKLGEAFYGRVRSYDEAFDALPDQDPLRALLARTAAAEGGDVEGLTRYMIAALDRFTGEAGAGLVDGRADWPGATA